jgi:hypothetical protein
MPFGTVSADVIQSSVANTSLGAGNASIMKNRVINGAMVIDQRNAGSAVTPTTDTYTLDRWLFATNVASKASVQQNAGSVTPPDGYKNYLGITSTSAYTSLGATDVFVIRQKIEGYNVADLGFGTANAKTVTLSFWVRSSLTGTFAGSLNNSAENRSYPFSYTISVANTWEQKSITVAGDTTGTWLTTNGTGLEVGFSMGMGSTFSGTAGAWAGSALFSATGATSVVGTNGATFYITGVQLEVGSSATGYEYVNYQTSLANCQRYYQLITTASGGSASGSSFQCAATLSPPMRATPSISGTTARCSDLYTSDYSAASPTFGTFETMGVSGGRLEIGGFSGMTAGRPTVLLSGGTNAAPIRFSAEL